MSHNRALSPSGRRTADSRYTDAGADTYLSHRHNSSVLPRGSNDRVIPISTQTYISGTPSSASGAARSTGSSYDSYGSRPKRSSLVDSSRTSMSSNSARARPTVIQSDAVRSASPLRDDRSYYVTTASSKDARDARGAKKIYTMDTGGARLISETEVHPDDVALDKYRQRRHHSRTDSGDGIYRDVDRSSRSYAPVRKDKSIDDDDAFSYTDAAGMYRETQPSWRERDVRPRRASLDRHGNSRERPTSGMMDVARKSREIGPPPSQRGWDKINDGIGRTKSMRDGPREVERSPQRGRDDDKYVDLRDMYHNAPRHESKDRSRHAYHDSRNDKYDPYESDSRREPQHRARRLSAHKAKDRSISRRGFGVRADSLDREQLRHSDESLDSYNREEPGYDGRRREVASDTEHVSKQHRKHRHELDREMDKRRDRSQADHNRDDYDRVRRPSERDDIRETRPRDDSRDVAADRGNTSQGSGANVAAGGLAAGASAAALYGLSHGRGAENDRYHNRNSDEHRSRHDTPRDADVERHRAARPDDVPYPDDRGADRGLGFVFEAPPASEKVRSDAGRSDTSHDMSRDEQRKFERTHEDMPPALQPDAPVDPDEEYRQRIQLAQRELGHAPMQTAEDSDRDRRRREREMRMHSRREHLFNGDTAAGASSNDRSPLRSSFDSVPPESSTGAPSSVSRPNLQRRASVVDDPMPPNTQAVILDNSQSEMRETKVRIVDPPTEEEERKPKGILKRPTQKFPDHPNPVREGVAPLKDSTKKGIPPGARWTKIDRRLVNPQALEEAKERYEERLDCVIVLRVLTKDEIQKLADRTKELRGMHKQCCVASGLSSPKDNLRRSEQADASTASRLEGARVSSASPADYSCEMDESFGNLLRRTISTVAVDMLTSYATDKRFEAEGRSAKHKSRRSERDRDRRERDEYSDDDLEDWERDEKRPLRMLEAAPSASEHSERRTEQRER